MGNHDEASRLGRTDHHHLLDTGVGVEGVSGPDRYVPCDQDSDLHVGRTGVQVLGGFLSSVIFSAARARAATATAAISGEYRFTPMSLRRFRARISP